MSRLVMKLVYAGASALPVAGARSLAPGVPASVAEGRLRPSCFRHLLNLQRLRLEILSPSTLGAQGGPHR